MNNSTNRGAASSQLSAAAAVQPCSRRSQTRDLILFVDMLLVVVIKLVASLLR